MVRSREVFGAVLLAAAVAAGSAAGALSALAHPLAGTGLILLADAALERRRGASPLSREPQALVWMAILSIFLWTAVEALNEKRGLWAYLGWPAADLPRYALLGWHFSMIVPVLALTAEWLAGPAAWRRRAARAADVVAALSGVALFAVAVRGTLPGANAVWLTVGVLGLFLAGGGLRQQWPRVAAWASAGAGWIALSQAVNLLGPAQRYVVSPDGFEAALWPAALLVGPALGGLYQEAVERLGLDPWPPPDPPETFDTIAE